MLSAVLSIQPKQAARVKRKLERRRSRHSTSAVTPTTLVLQNILVVPPTQRCAILLDVAISGGLQVLCPQGLDETIDAATVLDYPGELRALSDVHANAFDDDVDDGKIAAAAAQPPIDPDVL